LDDCFELYRAERYEEVVARAEPLLGRQAGAPPSEHVARELAALWSLTGLARQGLGDEHGARAAFEAAIRAAPAAEQPTYRQHLVALALAVGRRLIRRADAMADPACEEGVAALRHAVLWLRQGLDAAPGDEDLAACLAGGQRQLWDAYEQLAAKLIHRQEFPGARRLIREALGDDALPAERRDGFGELLLTTFSGEVGRLTALAVRAMQDEREPEALASLGRAETLLRSIPADALAPARRAEVNRRLWWGYTKLALRRVEGGEWEAALDPLFRALGFADVDADRLAETRAALLRAVTAVSDARSAAIDRLRRAGRRDDAVRETEGLRRLLDEAVEAGLSPEALSAPLAEAQRLSGELEVGR
jgi:tetratricopeptide (TPR) repeat protein